MPREGMGSGTEEVVDCHGQGWAVTRDREGSGTEGVVVCHDPGRVVAKGKEGHGTASCSWSHEAGRLVARAPRPMPPTTMNSTPASWRPRSIASALWSTATPEPRDPVPVRHREPKPLFGRPLHAIADLRPIHVSHSRDDVRVLLSEPPERWACYRIIENGSLRGLEVRRQRLLVVARPTHTDRA